MKNLPNILFLMSDEHRADVTGYEGNTVVRTPALDELARTGVVFRNTYTPSPICVPGRQSMMAGQLPKTCNCRCYGEDLAPGYMTFARRFAQCSYNTVACGKLHHTGIDQMQGWTRRIGGDVTVGERFIEGKETEFFDKIVKNPDYSKWSEAKEVLRAGIGKAPHIVADEYTVQGAINFIDNYFLNPYYDRVQKDRPLLLKVSIQQPHYPYFTTEELFNYYLNRVKIYDNEKVSTHPFMKNRQVRPGIDASVRDIRRAVAAYYGMVETMDGYFGKIMDKLKQVGEDLDNWIIVYTSDHGEMLGQHGIWEKKQFFEASVRVPLIIRWPKGFSGGRTIYENVSLCDLFATLCELAGISVPPGLDSRSLVPFLKGESYNWNNEAISQYGVNKLMIKQDHLKYQYYGPDMPEVLFDLKKDPGEEIDFMNNPEYTNIVKYFRKRRAELGYGPNACSDCN